MKNNKVKRIFTDMCVLFTVSVFLFYLLGDSLITDMVPAMTLKTITCFLAFSLALGALNMLLRGKKPSVMVRFLLHFAGTMAAVGVIFIGFCGFAQTGAQRMIFFIFAAFVYIAVMLFRKLVLYISHKIQKT